MMVRDGSDLLRDFLVSNARTMDDGRQMKNRRGAPRELAERCFSSRSGARCVAIWALFVVGCGGDGSEPAVPTPPPAPPPAYAEPPSILMLTIDTLRADHLGVDSDRDSTPFLNELASRSIDFRRCFAQSSWTLPSMLSLICAKNPPEIGVKDGISLERHGKVEGGTSKVEYFAEGHVTLPEVLQDQGYYTVGISSSPHLTRRQGFHQGFQVFEEESCMLSNAECVLDLARKELREIPSQPFFLWVHFFDPHFDQKGSPPTYATPRGYERLFSEPDLDMVESVQADYDRKIRFLDDRLRGFFRFLGDRELRGNLIVVIAADHGEEFLEKQRWGHAKALTNTLLHVPLILRLPDHAYGGTVVDRAVSNIDVMPTLLDLLDIPVPSGIEGVSLVPTWTGGDSESRLIYSETQRRGLNMRCLIDPETNLKFVFDLHSGTKEVYDLARDGLELENLASERADEVAAAEERLLRWISAMEGRAIRQEGVSELSEEEAQALESLGYLGDE